LIEGDMDKIDGSGKAVTFADKFITYQFWFEYGIGKFGVYLAVINIGLLVTTLLTVKGIYFPVWSVIPIGIGLILFCTTFGWFLDTYNVMGRLNSHMNRKGNPEFVKICADVEEIKKMLELQKKRGMSYKRRVRR
jgi:hypothetical protein